MIVFSKSDLDKIVEHSQDTFPVEACGILLGKRESNIKRVTMIFPTENILESESSYQINPQEQLDVFMKADELSLEVLGYYHSHPYWHAQPSSTDRQRANQPCCSYVVYSNIDNEVKSFHWDGVEFRPEELIISEDQPDPVEMSL